VPLHSPGPLLPTAEYQQEIIQRDEVWQEITGQTGIVTEKSAAALHYMPRETLRLWD